MKKTALLGVVAVGLLAQCNKISQLTGSGAEASPQVVAEVVPSLPLITNHASPHFMEVAQHLELGGAYFNYAEQHRLMESIGTLMDDGFKSLPASQRKNLPKNFSFVKLFNQLGLNDVRAMGASSHLKSSGLYHSRSFALMPEGRKGLMTLNGGEPEPLMTLQVAPKGTDLAVEFPLHLKTLANETLVNLLAMMPAAARGPMEAPLNEPVPLLGISARELVEKLDARLGLFVKVYPDQELPVPGATVPIPGMDVMVVMDRAGWMLEPIKKQFLPMLNNPLVPVKVVDEDGVLTIAFKEPVGPAPADFQPMLRYDSKTDRLMFATRVSFLQQAIEGKELLKKTPDFKAAWEGMPEKGNSAVYMSPILLKTLQSMAKSGIATSEDGPAMQEMLTKAVDFLTPYLEHGQAACVVNMPKGTLALANMAVPLSNNSTVTTVATLSVIGAIAVPSIGSINKTAAQHVKIRQGLEIYQAVQAYAAEHNQFPQTLQQLVDAELLKIEDAPSQWLYNAMLTDASPSDSILLASERLDTGKRCVVRLDGNSEAISEAEFQEQKDENLTRR